MLVVTNTSTRLLSYAKYHLCSLSQTQKWLNYRQSAVVVILITSHIDNIVLCILF